MPAAAVIRRGRALFGMIVSLPAVYVVSWTLLGLFCFVFSLSSRVPSSGPLFYTGYTWLGLSIKVAYSFFGVSDSTTSAKDERPDVTRSENQVDVEERLEPYPSLFDADTTTSHVCTPERGHGQN